MSYERSVRLLSLVVRLWLRVECCRYENEFMSREMYKCSRSVCGYDTCAASQWRQRAAHQARRLKGGRGRLVDAKCSTGFVIVSEVGSETKTWDAKSAMNVSSHGAPGVNSYDTRLNFPLMSYFALSGVLRLTVSHRQTSWSWSSCSRPVLCMILVGLFSTCAANLIPLKNFPHFPHSLPPDADHTSCRLVSSPSNSSIYFSLPSPPCFPVFLPSTLTPPTPLPCPVLYPLPPSVLSSSLHSIHSTMAFINALPIVAPSASARTALCRRRPRMAALDAPVKEDLRSKLNNLLAATPTATPDTDPDRVKQKVDPGKHYKVLIFNDEAHSKDYVTRVLLMVVPGLTQEAAWKIMNEAHTNGKAVVGVWIFEISEGYCDMLRNNGLRSDIEEA